MKEIVAHVIDAQFIKNGAVVRTATVFFYLSNEGISIIENVAWDMTGDRMESSSSTKNRP